MKTTATFGRMVIMAALVVFASGCANTAITKQVEQIGDDLSSATRARHDAISHPVTPSSSFEISHGFYAARKPLVNTATNVRKSYPAAFSKEASITIQTPVSVYELMSRVATLLGSLVVVDADIASSATPASTPRGNVPPPTELPPLPGALGGPDDIPVAAPTQLPPLPGLDTVAGRDTVILNDFVYTGSVAGLLDTATSRLGLSWRWTGERVEVYRYETRAFRLNALAGTSQTDARLDTTSESGSRGGGGGSGGQTGVQATGESGQQTTFSSQSNIWEDVERTLASLLSSNGSLNMSPSAGLVTVRDTPSVLSVVESQISHFNAIYGRQVSLNVEVYSIERSIEDSVGVNWALAFQNAAGNGFNMSSGSTLGEGAQSFTFSQTGNRWGGSRLVVSALSALGRTSLLTSGTVITTNGQTAPLNIANEQAYLASFSTTLGGGVSGGTTTTLTPGIIMDGFSMNFTPRILDNNEILLRYALDLSRTEDITTFETPDGSAAIQLPRRTVRSFLQNVQLAAGETLVLAGFQQLDAGQARQGVGSPKNWGMGGRRTSENTARTIVIAITPNVL